MNKAVFVVIVWLILAVTVAGSLGNRDTVKFWRLARHGVQCTGVVTEVLTVSHNTVRYQYTVSNETYAGKALSLRPNPPAATLHAGDPLIVFFDSDKPSSSVLADPGLLLRHEITIVGLIAVLFPTFIIVFGFKNRPKKEAGRRKISGAFEN